MGSGVFFSNRSAVLKSVANMYTEYSGSDDIQDDERESVTQLARALEL